MDYICSKCGKKVSVSTRQARCSCGGLWKLDFTPPPFRPDGIDKSQWSQFRYRKYMALEDESWRELTLGEGMTPVVRMDGNVLLKMDYMMPTLSYKDRGAAVLMAHCKAAGVDYVVQDSSGNAGNSIAAYASRAGIPCEIFVPQGTSPKKIAMIRAHGAVCTVVPPCAGKRPTGKGCTTPIMYTIHFSMRGQRRISTRSWSSWGGSRNIW